MSTTQPELPDPEDMFNDTRMSFGDHIEDLRSHLLKAVYGFVFGMVVSLLFLGPWVLGIIVSPVEAQLDRFEQRKWEKALLLANDRTDLGEKPARLSVFIEFHRADIKNILEDKDVDPPVLDVMSAAFARMLTDLDATDLLNDDNRKQHSQDHRKHNAYVRLPVTFTDAGALAGQVQKAAVQVRGKRLATMNITEAFMVYLKVSALTGLVISSPYVFWQIWMFIAAGLYPHEKKLVNVYLPFSLFLFIFGVLVCQFLVMPRAIEAMLWFNEWLGLDADLRLNEWLGFALMMPLVFGVSFQTPLVMMFAHRIGMVTAQTYRDKRRIAWFGMAVFAALITPSLDAMSMLFLWVPMGALYEFGILLCVWQGEEEDLAEWEKEEKANELVEV